MNSLRIKVVRSTITNKLSVSHNELVFAKKFITVKRKLKRFADRTVLKIFAKLKVLTFSKVVDVSGEHNDYSLIVSTGLDSLMKMT